VAKWHKNLGQTWAFEVQTFCTPVAKVLIEPFLGNRLVGDQTRKPPDNIRYFRRKQTWYWYGWEKSNCHWL